MTNSHNIHITHNKISTYQINDINNISSQNTYSYTNNEHILPNNKNTDDQSHNKRNICNNNYETHKSQRKLDKNADTQQIII
jgi:hypothetical protein